MPLLLWLLLFAFQTALFQGLLAQALSFPLQTARFFLEPPGKKE
jgi:hypothetical protein